ncbi:MAG: dihydroxyacetone kinase subunit DhaK [Candidatus Dormibacteraeota bacterium]|nr:dihydroxyacetone kinase subunit DhaK [Candidatus Dormibacteraeota bacterium]
MKKLINAPQDLVREALEGLAVAHPDLLDVHLEPHYVVRRGGTPHGKVALVSGGGSGHEPMHSGFVGRGMLDGACPGEIFTSPTPDQIAACTQRVAAGAGVLHLVKNYTGDVMNFEIAAELAAADGVDVRSVVVDDDVAVRDSLYTAGRRGVGGTVLIEKLIGARAEEGATLEQVEALARRARESVRSMGMALTPCTVPQAGKPNFELADDEMEIGIGIHGEPGRERMRLEPADRVVDRLLEPIIEDLPFRTGDRVLCFVNGMGGTPLIELLVVLRHAAEVLTRHGLRLERSLVGSYITSLEMAGCSLTLLRMDDEMVRLWDAPVVTPALRWGRDA